MAPGCRLGQAGYLGPVVWRGQAAGKEKVGPRGWEMGRHLQTTSWGRKLGEKWPRGLKMAGDGRERQAAPMWAPTTPPKRGQWVRREKPTYLPPLRWLASEHRKDGGH